MEIKMLARSISSPLLAAAILLTAGSALAQEQKKLPSVVVETPVPVPPRPSNACPAPINLTLNANTPSVFGPDFVPAQLANQVGLNYSGTDKHYLHTFQWKREHCCCRITEATLTVRMKANQSGQATNSPDAGNDNIALFYLGVPVPPYNERVYRTSDGVVFPFPKGQPATRTWNLQGLALLIINAENRLSFDVEDDTMVQSATLHLTGCCLTN